MEQKNANETQTANQTRPWLQALMLREPGRWSSRLSALWLQLKSMGRGGRRRFGRAAASLGAGAAGLALLALMAGPLAPPVHAATINVDATCSLIDAIKSANTDTAVNTCEAGSGADTIVLGGNVNLAAKYGSAAVYESNIGLPVISSTITIQSSGSNNFTIARTADDTDRFRIFTVNISGSLTLRNVTVSNGFAYDKVKYGEAPNYFYGFKGKGGAIYSYEADVTLENVTMSGNKARRGGGGVFMNYSSGNTPDLTITNSVFTGNETTNTTTGGAIYFDRGTLTINDSTFSNNRGTSKAGAVYIDFGTVTISNTTFSGNTAGFTGAVYNDGGDVTIINSRFISNTAISTSSGAIYADDGTLTIIDSTFIGNQSAQHGGAIKNDTSPMTVTGSAFINNSTFNRGGAIYSEGGIVSVTDSTFIGNRVDEPAIGAVGGSGGAIYLGSDSSGVMTITGSLIDNNEVTRRGGGIANNGNTLIIIDTTISNNRVIYETGGPTGADVGMGGGVFADEDPLTIINSTISGNSAFSSGGGVAFRMGSAQYAPIEVTLDHVTMIGNSTEASGGGLFVSGTTPNSYFPDMVYSPPVTITSSIISGNSADVGADEVDVITTTMTTSHNVLGHDGISYGAAFSGFTLDTTDFDATSPDCRSRDCRSSGRSAPNSSPTALTDILDTTLADNGGPDLPGGAAMLTHNLVEDSPAVDIVSGATCDLSTDQRGEDRPQLDGCDAGAVEYVPVPPTACFDEGVYEKTLILGSGMGSHTGAKPQVAVKVLSPMNVITNYGQIVGKETAAYNGIARFTPAGGSNSHIWVYTPTAQAEFQGAEWWYGAQLTPATSRLWKASMFRGNNYPHQPRAFVMYPTYSQKELNWDYVELLTEDNTVYHAPGWTPVQSRTIQLPGPLPYSRDISVRVAAVDNDSDQRPIKVTVRTVGEGPNRGPAPVIELTQSPKKPTHGKLLNIMHFFLNDVPAGTTAIEVEWSALAPNGDSFTVTGITANFECGEVVPGR